MQILLHFRVNVKWKLTLRNENYLKFMSQRMDSTLHVFSEMHWKAADEVHQWVTMDYTQYMWQILDFFALFTAISSPVLSVVSV